MSSRLMTVLQTAAFPFRHCTELAPLDGIEPPYLRSERSALPLSERGIGQGGRSRSCGLRVPSAALCLLSYTLLIGLPDRSRTCMPPGP